MKRVLALQRDFGTYLSKNEQMEEFLQKGFSLYLVENGRRVLLASPQKGILIPLPDINETKNINLKG